MSGTRNGVFSLPKYGQWRQSAARGAWLEAAMDVVRQELAQDLGRAARALRSGNRSDPRIHDIRKRLKHCRALLRLLRKSLGNDAYQVENAQLRDAVRPLMPVRDAAVLVRALDDLCRSEERRVGKECR